MNHDYAKALEDFEGWYADDEAMSPVTTAAIRSALQLAMDSGWREIESAPKDATHVLLTDGQDVSECWFCDVNCCWNYASTHPSDYVDGRYENAIKWRPLPQPPEASK